MDRQDKDITLNTPAAQVVHNVRDGDEFLLITRNRGSHRVTVWGSTDAEDAEKLYKAAASTVLQHEPTS